MNLTRRSFLRYCGLSATALGLGPVQIGFLRRALADDADAPSVIWLQGSSCTGCSVSLLNHISNVAGGPTSVTDLLVNHINLVFHPTVMALAGESAVTQLKQAYERGGYVLVVEGAVPTAFGGHACIAYTWNGRPVAFKDALTEYAARAAAIVCVGTCASFGGIPASGSNPTGAMSAGAHLGTTTINISGCPANPHWVVKAIVMLLLGQEVPLDAHGRPVALYEAFGTIHDSCPRNLDPPVYATQFGQDGRCLLELGCRGPFTKANCRNNWNGLEGEGHWCIGVNAPCHGCVEPTFPGTASFYQEYTGP